MRALFIIFYTILLHNLKNLSIFAKIPGNSKNFHRINSYTFSLILLIFRDFRKNYQPSINNLNIYSTKPFFVTNFKKTNTV